MAKSDPVKVLRRCFTQDEWEWLQGDPVFKQRLKNVKSLEDVEAVSCLGDELIYNARQAKNPSRKPPPEQRRP